MGEVLPFTRPRDLTDAEIDQVAANGPSEADQVLSYWRERQTAPDMVARRARNRRLMRAQRRRLNWPAVACLAFVLGFWAALGWILTLALIK